MKPLKILENLEEDCWVAWLLLSVLFLAWEKMKESVLSSVFNENPDDEKWGRNIEERQERENKGKFWKFKLFWCVF